MASTREGIEFHLLSTRFDREADAAQVESQLRTFVREGDAVFLHGGRPFVALVGDLEGALRATSRLLRAIEDRQLRFGVSLEDEPFESALEEAAAGVVEGWVKISSRPA